MSVQISRSAPLSHLSGVCVKYGAIIRYQNPNEAAQKGEKLKAEKQGSHGNVRKDSKDIISEI